MDGQAKAVAWLSTWISSWRGSIRSITTTPSRWLCSSSIRRGPRPPSSGVSAAPRHSTSCTLRRQLRRQRAAGTARPSAGCSGPRRPRWAARGRCPGHGRRRRSRRGSTADVDAVVDHLDLAGIHLRVAAQDVLAHALRDGDDGGGGFVGGLLHPGGQARSRRPAARPSTGAAAPGCGRSAHAGCRAAARPGARPCWRTRCANAPGPRRRMSGTIRRSTPRVCTAALAAPRSSGTA